MRLYGQVGSEVGHGSEGMAAGRREVDVVIADDRDNLGNANLVAVISWSNPRAAAPRGPAGTGAGSGASSR